jgi:hypothetical protein
MPEFNDQSGFSKEYSSPDETKIEVEQTEQPSLIKIDTELYGSGKPKRKIIRAKITHGNRS